MGDLRVVCFVLIATGCCLMGSATAMTHIVGASNGWTVPDNLTFFADWAKPRTFGVGDTLVFPYRPGSNNVVEVGKEDYESCMQDEVVNMYFMGPTILDLKETGDRYFYCGIGKHCEAGQKLHVTVVDAAGSSGSDPLPFKLDDIGVDENGNSSISPAPSALIDTVAAKVPSAATSSAIAKLGLVSLFSGLVISIVV